MKAVQLLGFSPRMGATVAAVFCGLLLSALCLEAQIPVVKRAGSASAAHVSTSGTSAVARSLANDSAAVAATVERFHRALAEGDSATALSLLAEDAIILESGGVETKEEYRGHHLPGDIAFARAVRSERGPMRVVVRGDAAWATSTSTVRGEYQGRQINSQGAELMVLTRVADDWRISAIHWSSRTLRQ
ncbi:MAG TPA: nuclear transport factor 2 family protein [Longimicrobiaceae bacterium]|nr:nuclear transport factor 2 family protein [Longimicrobiaceae bacterium]